MLFGTRNLLRTARPSLLNRFHSTLVLVEHNNKVLNTATLSAITAASRLGFPITALVAGKECGEVANAASEVKNVSEVFVANDAAFDNHLPENIAPFVQHVVENEGFSHVVAPHTAYGKSVLFRLASYLNVSPVSDVIEVKSANKFVRLVYAGNAMQTVESTDPKIIFTARLTAFDKMDATGGNAAVKAIPIPDATDSNLSSFVSEELRKSDRPDLTSAPVVISGGRGMKNGENFKMLEELADLMGGAVGASRAAVDAGMVPNDLQVGQTGKVVAPELYIAVGISGAIQHLAGMKDSKTIVAINKDAEAPIFQVADYGLVADLFKAVPELTEKVKASK